MRTKASISKRGRPRAFDAAAALDRALNVFWKKGYEGTSLLDLTRAMKINRPSLYAAFGNKESLFRKALDRYAEGPACYVSAALAEPTARKAVEQLFRGMIDLMGDPKNPRGCLMVQAALSCGDEANCVRKELIARREGTVDKLRERFVRAQSEGDLPKSADAADLARFFTTVMHGMSVQAASGSGQAELRRVVKTAMRAWPT